MDKVIPKYPPKNLAEVVKQSYLLQGHYRKRTPIFQLWTNSQTYLSYLKYKTICKSGG